RRYAQLVTSGAGEFATRFQQTSAMVMAKGVEDTAFYRYHRLAALCEVGSDPASFGSPEDFHAYAAQTARNWPNTMTTLSTHDTKRSEDVRARVLALGEHAEQWRRRLARWMARHPAPEANIGYLFWQSLVGAWPLSAERATQYLNKAAREAKQHTSWTKPDAAFDRALAAFCARVFDDAELLMEVGEFVSELQPATTANCLGAKLVQLSMPGVPDVYQGAEQVYRRLVDPDNRAAAQLPPTPTDELDAVKARLTRTALRLRRARPEAFGAAAGYQQLSAVGSAARHLLAFRRGGPVTVATRRAGELARGGGWGDTCLNLGSGSWTDLLTDRTHRQPVLAAELLAELPVALLVVEEG
ncbi:MAG: malto-oligosyltrehalose synthase, partial [Mycobacteriales bacterium]